MTQQATRPDDRRTAGAGRGAGGAGNGGATGGRPNGRATVSGAGRRSGPSGTLLGLRAGQLVVAQAAAAMLIAALATDPAWLALAAPVAFILLVLAFGRFRRRWLYQWIGQGSRYFGRRRTLPAGSSAAGLLALLRPAAITTATEVDGVPVGVIEDTHGLTAILEIGDTNGLLAEVLTNPVPNPGSLLPAAAAEQPAVRLQVLITGVAAPAAGTASATAATSYRQLTEGRILAQQRVLLAVHVRRVGGFADSELQRSLASAVRRVRRKLERAELPCRALAGDSVLQVLADLAHHDGAHAGRESWSSVDLGGLRQVCFRLTRWPDLRGELSRVIISRLLTMPGGSTTVSLAVERAPENLDLVRAELLIRLAAPSPTLLSASIDALRSLLGSAGAKARRLDGAQLDALAATLPLGGAGGGPSAALAGMVAGHDGLGLDGVGLPVSAEALAALEISVGGAGLMLGVNRHGTPVTVRLFRPEPTRAALIGGIRAAQLMVLRALALGAKVVVQSGRPYAWEPFLRGVSNRGNSVVTMVAPGRILEPPPASPVQPQLLVVDVGPVGATGLPVVEAAWRATLLVRDELNQADVDVLSRADLALLQPLTQSEAYVASSALGLGDSAGWLTRIRADMVGVVVGRRTLRWALLSGTPIEEQLVGPPAR